MYVYFGKDKIPQQKVCVFVYTYTSFKLVFSVTIYLSLESCWMEKMANECNNNLTEKME